MEGEGPLSNDIVDQAAEWLVKVWSGTATADDHEACARWRSAHPDHELAWQRLQAFERKLEAVPPSAARKALSPTRRRILKGVGTLLAGGAAAHAIQRTNTWRRYVADYRTRTGEQRTIALADATRVTLNTASALDVQFDAQRRQVDLRAGEIMVATSPDPVRPPRPFIVSTSQGTVRAIGTRFTVRQIDDDTSRVAVFEGAVLIQPAGGSEPAPRLDAGQQISFSRTNAFDVAPADESAAAWTHGSLLVERMRLADFIEELSRYRPGLLSCDPAAGEYLLTGVYPLADTDRILASIEKALPVRVVYRNQYWVTVTTR